MLHKGDELNGLLEQMAQKYAIREPSRQLELLALHIAAFDERVADYVLQGATPMDADLQEYWTAGSGDGEIDGLLFDPTTNSITIVQATKVSRWDEKLSQKAKSFFSKLPVWAAHASSTDTNLNAKTTGLLRESEIDIDNSDIRLVFVTNIPTGSGPAEKLHIEAAAVAENYAKAGRRVSCEVWGQTDILRLHEEMQNAFNFKGVDHTRVKLRQGNFFELHEPYHTIVGALSTNELRAIYKQRGVTNRIFNANIRMALGGKNKINQQIAKSLASESDLFFYYNNGVTAMCANFEVRGNEVIIDNLQVVNGAQTVSSIANVPPSDDAFVLFRLIATGEKYRKKNEFPDRVTKFQNTQNPVKASDFFSTDPFQEWLRRNLAKRACQMRATRTFWYAHKRGWKDDGGKGAKVDMETLAKLRHAMLYDPNRAYNAPRDIWDESNYWEAFGIDGSEVQVWDDESIAQVAWGVTTFLTLRDDAKKAAEVGRSGKRPNMEASYLSYLSIFVTAISFQFIRFLQDEGEAESFLDIMSTPSNYAKFDAVQRKVRELVLDRLTDLQNQQGANPKFYLARDKSAFSQMLNLLKSKYDTGQLSI